MSLLLLSSHLTAGEAHLVAGLLRQQGLHPEVRGEARAPLRGELPLSATLVEVWVPAGEAEAARALLAEVEAGAAASRQVRPCPGCREENPGNFELCWACGQELPEGPPPHLRLVAS